MNTTYTMDADVIEGLTRDAAAWRVARLGRKGTRLRRGVAKTLLVDQVLREHVALYITTWPMTSTQISWSKRKNDLDGKTDLIFHFSPEYPVGGVYNCRRIHFCPDRKWHFVNVKGCKHYLDHKLNAECEANRTIIYG